VAERFESRNSSRPSQKHPVLSYCYYYTVATRKHTHRPPLTGGGSVYSYPLCTWTLMHNSQIQQPSPLINQTQ
jgi:hypothetical protein